MGVGKSTVGYFLADLLGFELIDTDKTIEHRTGKRITEIFQTDGEVAFRKMESDLVAELELLTSKVIATGGGLIVDTQNLASLKTHALVACLWASPETIFERVRNQSHRPLLHTPDPLERIRNLLAERTPFYREADLVLGVDFRHAADVARHIAKSFHDASHRMLRPDGFRKNALPPGGDNPR
jgi:shikimate kinase